MNIARFYYRANSDNRKISHSIEIVGYSNEMFQKSLRVALQFDYFDNPY